MALKDSRRALHYLLKETHTVYSLAIHRPAKRMDKMSDKITLDRVYLRDDILSPLAALYGEIESTGRVADMDELEVVLVKLNKTLKEAN